MVLEDWCGGQYLFPSYRFAAIGRFRKNRFRLQLAAEVAPLWLAYRPLPWYVFPDLADFQVDNS